MEATFRIHTDKLTGDILDNIKRMFPNKTVEITVQPADETDYILENPNFARELKERIEAYESGKKVIAIKAEELL